MIGGIKNVNLILAGNMNEDKRMCSRREYRYA